VDLTLKKPNWLLLIRSISRQNFITLSKTIFSLILQAIEVREIGRQFSLEDLGLVHAMPDKFENAT